jgi:hypothetical protein
MALPTEVALSMEQFNEALTDWIRANFDRVYMWPEFEICHVWRHTPKSGDGDPRIRVELKAASPGAESGCIVELSEEEAKSA